MVQNKKLEGLITFVQFDRYSRRVLVTTQTTGAFLRLCENMDVKTSETGVWSWISLSHLEKVVTRVAI